ncbi:MAG: hypothetical protein GC171_02115 [Terrimonas sp.]|nr:hypothetical protein [Terrimonas sp.]
MRGMKWVGIVAAIILVISCFLPWYIISWKGFTVTGLDAGETFGKPGYNHFVFAFFFLVFSLIPKVWAKRWNLLVVGLNLAWAARNYFVISTCEAGLCPEKKIGIFLVLGASVLMLVAALFPHMEISPEEKK